MADRMYQGFLRTTNGALVVVGGAAPALPIKMKDGYVVDQTGALVVTTALGGTDWRQGHKRVLLNGILLVSIGGPGPWKWRDGDLIDANGAIVITQTPAAGEHWHQGALRAADEALVCDIRGTP